MSDAADEPWREFATRDARRDPDLTITFRDHLAPTLLSPSSGASPSARTQKDVDLAIVSAKSERAARDQATLPYISIAPPGAAPSEGSDFEVTGVLGEGGMGKILSAHQRSLGREVAIKIVKPEIAAEHTLGGLFDEARVTGSLEHPSIVPVHALGRDDAGRPVLVMKRIDGVPWRTFVKEPDHPRWEALAARREDRFDAHLDVAMAVCNALHFAHARGIVHRDVKLENVMIGSFGDVYVVDWGIAVSAPVPGKKSPTVGTPSYMPPELVVGDLGKTGPATDVYLVAATLHHALTGKPRHLGDSIFEVLHEAHSSRPFVYGDEVPAELAAILNRAMSPKPEDRFESALALRRALVDFKNHRGSIAMSDEAELRLAELKGAAGDERRVEALMIEARFGFLQALRAWSDNDAAREGLEETIVVSIDHAVARRDLDRARALAAELVSPDPALAARLDELEAELGRERDENARARAVARDHDVRVGARFQVGVMSALLAFVGGLGAYYFTLTGTISFGFLIAPPVASFVLLVAARIFLRHRIKNEIGRRALTATATLPLGAIVHRLIAFKVGEPFFAVAAGDLVMGAVAFALLGITLLPAAAWAAVPMVLGAIATAEMPDLALQLFILSILAAFAIALAAWRRTLAS